MTLPPCLPSIVFIITLLLNFVLWAHGSSAALPFLTILALIGLWFGVSVPLTFVGAYFGFRKRVLEHPVSGNGRGERVGTPNSPGGGGGGGVQTDYEGGLEIWLCIGSCDLSERVVGPMGKDNLWMSC